MEAQQTFLEAQKNVDFRIAGIGSAQDRRRWRDTRGDWAEPPNGESPLDRKSVV